MVQYWKRLNESQGRKLLTQQWSKRHERKDHLYIIEDRESSSRAIPFAWPVFISAGALYSLLRIMIDAKECITKSFVAALDAQSQAHVTDLVLALP